MSNLQAARKNMVDCQIHPAGVVMPALLQAYETVPRERFAPPHLQHVACADRDLPLGGGRYLLDSSTHARMLQAAAPEQGDVVLDIGGATGYSAAILSGLVARVIAVEENAEFMTRAQNLWRALGLANIAGRAAPLAGGEPQFAPYDIIVVNGAVRYIPPELVAQLKPDGRLVTIVKPAQHSIGQATLATPTGQGQFSSYVLFEIGAHELPGFAPPEGFVF